MTSMTKGGGGSFREIRERHLPLFDESVHRHDHGWPHGPPPARKEHPDELPKRRPKRAWKRVGIFHFPANHDED